MQGYYVSLVTFYNTDKPLYSSHETISYNNSSPIFEIIYALKEKITKYVCVYCVLQRMAG